MQGDFNARTNREVDYIAPDKYDLESTSQCEEETGPFGFSCDTRYLPNRNSEDAGEVNIRGTEFLNICKSLNMIILNGRKNGDLFGKFTSFQWNGKAVVDYVIVPTDHFDDVVSFNVGNYSPFLSDHCPVAYEIKTFRTITEEKNVKLLNAPSSYRLSFEDQKKLTKTLKSEEIRIKLANVMENQDVQAQNLANTITETLLQACDSSGLKPKKVKSSESSSEPWFDRECLSLKNSIKKKCRKLRNTPNCCKKLDHEILTENKQLKKLVKQKKKEYKNNIINEMSLKKREQKLFWRLLDKLDNKKDNIFKDHISGDRWTHHFKKVLRDEARDIVYPPNSDSTGPLDYEITLQELIEASYVLRLNKSSASDLISNEMIRCLMDANPDILLKLFNTVFQTNEKIEQWALALITPILKSGPKMDPSNYRGISIISCLGKFYTSILNKRLLKYCIENKILKPEQLGFLAGNRTSDAHLILYSMIQQYCHQKNEKIFSCFVDFSKAFDTIPRDLLFQKLLDRGVNGKFFNNVKTLYANDNCCIKVGDKITESFLANQGVKQGCILSPLLFNIFLSDIVDQFKDKNCRPLKIDDSNDLSCLIWADDIVLTSQSEEGLRNMLSLLEQYVEKNRMSINTKKTKCMIFNKNGKFIRRSYALSGKTVETTNSYKYLGLLFTPSGEIRSALTDLRDRAMRALQILKNKMGNFFRLHPSTTISLFDSLVKPILLYSSDFWGCLKLPENNPIENMYVKFCKMLLGVQKQTCNTGVYLELGTFPIMLYGVKNCIKNWFRIHKKENANYLLLKTHKMAIQHNLPWTLLTKESLRKIGIGIERCKDDIFIKAFNRMKDMFHQESFCEITSQSSKLRTYGKLKTEPGRETYLDGVKNISERTALTKLRLSNHDLLIEKGRHQGLSKHDRLCPFCENSIETEEHFLIKCQTFSPLRKELYNKIKHELPFFTRVNENQKFVVLTSEPSAAHITANYLQNAFEIRRFLLAKHKPND